MTAMAPPSRTLRARPNLDQLRRQAKELLDAYRAGEPAAIDEVNARYRDADPATFALHESQLVLARSYGFDSWSKLKAHVDGANIQRLVEAVRAGDAAQVNAILDARPELVNMDVADHNEHRAIHHAVLERLPEMVRLLMARGADARKGIYPHRDATSAITIATDRGYDEIVAIIHDGERARLTARLGKAVKDSFVSIRDALAGTAAPAVAAVARGDVPRLQAIHDERLAAGVTHRGGFDAREELLTAAVKHDRPEILRLLLEWGLDPDERMRLDDVDEAVYTASGPLHHCATEGKLEMAKILLDAGASPNAHVYAAGSPMHRAFTSGNAEMIDLLASHGGVVDAITLSSMGQIDAARQILEDEAAGRLRDGVLVGTLGGTSVVDDLLWGGAGGGSPEIVRMCLDRLNVPPTDPYWYVMLREPMYIRPERPKHERAALVECFRLILERADPNVQGSRTRGWVGGRTLLHDLSGARHEMQSEDRIAIATMLLDAGARLDIRDDLLKSTPLGWACRWGHADLVQLLLDRGADPLEADAETWATPRAWADKRGHGRILQMVGG